MVSSVCGFVCLCLGKVVDICQTDEETLICRVHGLTHIWRTEKKSLPYTNGEQVYHSGDTGKFRKIA